VLFYQANLEQVHESAEAFALAHSSGSLSFLLHSVRRAKDSSWYHILIFDKCVTLALIIQANVQDSQLPRIQHTTGALAQQMEPKELGTVLLMWGEHGRDPSLHCAPPPAPPSPSAGLRAPSGRGRDPPSPVGLSDTPSLQVRNMMPSTKTPAKTTMQFLTLVLQYPWHTTTEKNNLLT